MGAKWLTTIVNGAVQSWQKTLQGWIKTEWYAIHAFFHFSFDFNIVEISLFRVGKKELWAALFFVSFLSVGTSYSSTVTYREHDVHMHLSSWYECVIPPLLSNCQIIKDNLAHDWLLPDEYAVTHEKRKKHCSYAPALYFKLQIWSACKAEFIVLTPTATVTMSVVPT